MASMLREYCRQLRLKTLPEMVEEIPYESREQYVTALLEHEVASRQDARVSRLLKKAGFPSIKSLDDYVFDPISWPSSSSKEAVLNLSFVERKENVLMLGAVGTGKTHLACALGRQLCLAGKEVRFFRAVDLVNLLVEKHQAGTLGRFLRELHKCSLLILDEVGFVPFHEDGSELLFNVVADCYEQRSVVVTTNLDFGQWNQVFGNNRLTAALIDRLVHHAHILAFTGESLRLRHAMERSQHVTLRTAETSGAQAVSG